MLRYMCIQNDPDPHTQTLQQLKVPYKQCDVNGIHKSSNLTDNIQSWAREIKEIQLSPSLITHVLGPRKILETHSVNENTRAGDGEVTWGIRPRRWINSLRELGAANAMLPLNWPIFFSLEIERRFSSSTIPNI